MKNRTPGLVICFLVLGTAAVLAQNPLIRDQFTADPTARVFQGRVCVYPSHDVNCGTEWFCMKDYHVFSSKNPVDWVDHGVVVDQEKVAWVDTEQHVDARLPRKRLMFNDCLPVFRTLSFRLVIPGRLKSTGYSLNRQCRRFLCNWRHWAVSSRKGLRSI